MHTLSITDAGFLYAETPLCPMHIASVQVLELPEGVSAAQFIVALKDYLQARIHTVPYLTSRLSGTGFGLNHPRWVRDPLFDIDNHVYEVPVATPGGHAEMEAAIAALHETHLDRSRPLWDLAVLTGLAGGRIAYYQRTHHACIDGIAGQTAIERLTDAAPDTRECVDADCRRPLPSLLDAFVSAWESYTRQGIDLWSRNAERVASGAHLAQRAINPGEGLGALGETAPRTRFNKRVGGTRSFACGEISMTDIKAVSRAFGGTVNDVFLAACGGALRNFLARRSELPRRSLVAGVPVSLRRPGDRSLDNQVTAMPVPLATDIEGAIERLQVVRAESARAKAVMREASAFVPQNVVLPGLGLFSHGMARMLETASAGDAVPMPFNLIVSNVPGPRAVRYSNGARMLTHYPVSIPAHGNGVNITVQSYAGTLYFSITACAGVLPDAAELRDDLAAELRALVRLAARGNVQPLRSTEPRVAGDSGKLAAEKEAADTRAVA